MYKMQNRRIADVGDAHDCENKKHPNPSPTGGRFGLSSLGAPTGTRTPDQPVMSR